MRLDAYTLDEAKQWMRDQSATGARCPCCNQFVKVYRRKLNSSMARALIILYRHGEDWVQFDHLVRESTTKLSHDYIGLHYWGLTERHPEKDGYWRITEAGIFFARKRLRVESHAVIYDANLVRLDGDKINITDALGEKFDYNELMGERPHTEEPQ